jgi:DNA-binding response OmpR family regulator
MLMTDEPQLRQSLRQSLEQSGYCVVDDIPASASDRQIPVNFEDGNLQPSSVLIVSDPSGVARRGFNTRTIPNKQFEWGPLAIDFDDHMVTVAGHRVHLTATEYSLLRILAERAGKLVTYREIVRKIWGHNDDNNRRCLRVYACSLRKKLRRLAECDLVLTEPVVGYRLAAV